MKEQRAEGSDGGWPWTAELPGDTRGAPLGRQADEGPAKASGLDTGCRRQRGRGHGRGRGRGCAGRGSRAGRQDVTCNMRTERGEAWAGAGPTPPEPRGTRWPAWPGAAARTRAGTAPREGRRQRRDNGTRRTSKPKDVWLFPFFGQEQRNGSSGK